MEETPTEYGTITCSIQHGDPHTEEIVVSTYDDLSGDNMSSNQSDDQMGEQVLGYLEVQPSDTDNATIILQPQGIEIDGQRLILTQGEVGNEIIVVVSSDQDSISEQTVAHFTQSGHHIETSCGNAELIDDSSNSQLEVIETEVCEVPHEGHEIQQQVFIEQNGRLSSVGVDIPSSLGDSVEIGSSADEKESGEKIIYLPMQSSKMQSSHLQSISLNSNEESTPNLMQLACIAQEIHSASQKTNQGSAKSLIFSENYDSSTDNEGGNALVVQDSIDLSANSQSIICATEYETDYLGAVDTSNNDFDNSSNVKIDDSYIDSNHQVNNTVLVVESSNSDDSHVIQIEGSNENVEYEDSEIPVEDHSQEVLDENQPEEIAESPADEIVEEIVDSPIEEIVDSAVEEIVDSPVEEIVESPVEEIVESPVEEIVESPVEEIVESQVEEIVESPTESQVHEVVESHAEEVDVSQPDEVIEKQTNEVNEDHSTTEKQPDDYHVVENVQSSYSIEEDKLQIELDSEGDNMEIDMERESSQPSSDVDELSQVKHISEKIVEDADKNLGSMQKDIESNDPEVVEIEPSKIDSGVNRDNESSSKEPDFEVEKSDSQLLFKDRSSVRSTRSQKPHILNIPKKRKISEIFYDSEDSLVSHKKELKEISVDTDISKPKDIDDSIKECIIETVIEQPVLSSRTRSRKSVLKNNDSENKKPASPNRTTRSAGQNKKSAVDTNVIVDKLNSYEKEITNVESSETFSLEPSQTIIAAEDDLAVSENMVIIDEAVHEEKSNKKSQKTSRISRGRHSKKISSQNESSDSKDSKTISDHEIIPTNDEVSTKADTKNSESIVVSDNLTNLPDVDKNTALVEKVEKSKAPVRETRGRRSKKKDLTEVSSDVPEMHQDSNFETNITVSVIASSEKINADAKVDFNDKIVEDIDITDTASEKIATTRSGRSRHSRKRNSKSQKSVDISDQSNLDSDITTINSETLEVPLMETPQEIETVVDSDKHASKTEHSSHNNKTKPDKIATPSRSTRTRSARNKELEKSTIDDPIHPDSNSEINNATALEVTNDKVDSDAHISDSQKVMDTEQTVEICENIPLRKTRARHVKSKSLKTDFVSEQPEEACTTNDEVSEKMMVEVSADSDVTSIKSRDVDNEPLADIDKTKPSSEKGDKIYSKKRSTRASRSKKSIAKESDYDFVPSDSETATSDTNSKLVPENSQELSNDKVDVTEKALDPEFSVDSTEKQNQSDEIYKPKISSRKTRASHAKKGVVKTDLGTNATQSEAEKKDEIINSTQEKSEEIVELVPSDQSVAVDSGRRTKNTRITKTVLNEKTTFVIPKETTRTRRTRKSDALNNSATNFSEEIQDDKDEQPPSLAEDVNTASENLGVDLNESSATEMENPPLTNNSSKTESISEILSTEVKTVIECKKTYGRRKKSEKQESGVAQENNTAPTNNNPPFIPVYPNEKVSNSTQDDLDAICSNSGIVAAEENLVITPKKTYTRKNKLKISQDKEETADLQNIKLFSCEDIMSETFEAESDKQETELDMTVIQEKDKELDVISLQSDVVKKAVTPKRKRKSASDKPETNTRSLRVRLSKETRKDVEETVVIEAPSHTTPLNDETPDTDVPSVKENTSEVQQSSATSPKEKLPPKKRLSKPSKSADKNNSSWDKLVKSSPAKFTNFKPINKKKLKEKVQKQFMSLCEPSSSKTPKRGRQKKQAAKTVVEVREAVSEPPPVFIGNKRFVSCAKRYDFVRERIQKSCVSSGYRTPYTCNNCTYTCYRIENIIAHNRVCYMDADTDTIDYSLDDMNRRQMIRGVDTKSTEEETSHSNDMSNGVSESFNGDTEPQSGNFSDYEPEDDMSSFSDEVKRKLGFSENDVVWVKVKNAFWPGLVCRLYHKDKKASVMLIDSPLQRKGFKIKIKKLLSFNDAEINKKILDEVGNSSDPENFLKSAQKAENYFRKKRILRCDVEPKSFFGIDCDSADDFQYSYESSSSNDSEEDEEEGDPLFTKDSELRDYEMLSDDEESPAYSKSADTHTIEIDPSKLLNCLLEGQVNDHLVEIINETLKSERHTKFFSTDPAEKEEIKHRSGFGPIDCSEHSKIFDHFHNLFKNCSDRGDEDPSIVIPYIYEVWIPEAIIKAISLVQDISSDAAEMIFESDASSENAGHISITGIEERYK